MVGGPSLFISRDFDQDYIIPAPSIGGVVGLHQKTVRRMSEAGQFPKIIKLTQRRHGYLASEVYKWLEERRA